MQHFTLSSQAGEAVPKIVEVDTDTDTVIATHQDTAEMIVGAMEGKVSPVIGKDVHLYLRILREMLLKLFVSSAAKVCFSSFYKNVFSLVLYSINVLPFKLFYSSKSGQSDYFL